MRFLGYKNKILNGKHMKVVELIKKLEELGYNEDTEISFGIFDYDGEWYDFELEEIEDEDREVGVDDIGVILQTNKHYDKLVMKEIYVDLEEDLRRLIQKYC
jgi:hypothetical protein